jgi:hypothetical protein
VQQDEVRPSPTRPAPLPDRLWVPAAIALLLSLAFVGCLLARADGDPSLLVHAGPPWTQPDGARGSLTVQPADEAFDGQFFYRLGTAPWSTNRTEAGVTFDLPSLRNARWGYGALAWVASGGDPDLVPWALIGVNLAAATAIGAIGGGLARTSGRHAAWGALLALWPGFAYSLSLDTSELVAAAFLLGGLLALRHRRWALTGLLLVAAVLTRDTTTAVPAALLVAGLWAAMRDRSGDLDETATATPADHSANAQRHLATAAAGGAALVAFGGWQLLQRQRFGSLPLTSSGDNNLAVPLTGLIDQLGSLVPPSGGDEAFRLLSVVGLLALLVGAAWAWRTTTVPVAERTAWVLAVAVVVLLNDYLWSGATAFLRASTEAGLLSILVLLGARRPRLLPLAGLGLAGLWALTAVAQLTKLG